jgi:hypothetical protein
MKKREKKSKEGAVRRGFRRELEGVRPYYRSCGGKGSRGGQGVGQEGAQEGGQEGIWDYVKENI